MQVNIQRASLIEGWMEHSELTWLAEQAQQRNLIVEIGSYKGRSTRALAENTGGKVIAIDNWRGEDHVPLTEGQRSKLYDEFRENVADLIDAKKILIWKIDHREITSESVQHFTPDMVFIDGSHLYEDVYRDIRTWLPQVSSGGIISGHDIRFDQVERAVRELLPNVEVIADTSLWKADVA